MKKIPTIFLRVERSKLAIDVVTPGCEWVFAGEGRATVKIDGTACLIRDGKMFKRYDARNARNAPEGFEPCEPAPDGDGKHWPGWLPVSAGDRAHHEAFARCSPLPDGTYELIGPTQAGNHHKLPHHELQRHGATCAIDDIPGNRTFKAIKSYLQRVPIEGIVYHHPDGRMAKVKRSDFGIEWPVVKERRDGR